MKKKDTIKCLASLLVLLGMFFMLAGCQQKEPEPEMDKTTQGAEVQTPDQEKEDDRTEYFESIQKENVLEQASNMKEVAAVQSEYADVQPMMEDMMAFEAAGEEGALPSYVFIGKLTADADAEQVSDLLMQKALSMPGMEDSLAQMQVLKSNGYIIMAAAENGTDIASKFALVMMLDGAANQPIQRIYEALSTDITGNPFLEE